MALVPELPVALEALGGVPPLRLMTLGRALPPSPVTTTSGVNVNFDCRFVATENSDYRAVTDELVVEEAAAVSFFS